MDGGSVLRADEIEPETMRQRIVALGMAGMVMGASDVEAHALVVDMDMGTAGIQSGISAAPASIVTVGVYLIDDGSSPLSGVGLSLNFNDGPLTVVSPGAPMVGEPPVAGVVDLVSGGPVASGTFLTSAGLPASGAGPGGAFTGTDGGGGYFEPTGGAFPGIGFFGGTAGAEILLMTLDLTVVGPAGSGTTISPVGILPIGGGPGAPADPKLVGPLAPGGAPFWDGDFFAGGGGYLAAPVPASSYPDAITPGTLTVTPEPGVGILGILGLVGLIGARRR